MALKTKWIDILYRVATGSRKMRNVFTPIGACFFAQLIFSLVVVALQVDKLIGISRIFPRPFHIILSLPILGLALFLMGWSIINFIRAKGTPVPFNPPPRLVTSGPYAYVRNPMLSVKSLDVDPAVGAGIVAAQPAGAPRLFLVVVDVHAGGPERIAADGKVADDVARQPIIASLMVLALAGLVIILGLHPQLFLEPIRNAVEAFSLF